MADDLDTSAKDKVAAQEIRGKMNVALTVVNGIVDSAKRKGYLVTFATGEVNGQQAVTKIEIVKKL